MYVIHDITHRTVVGTNIPNKQTENNHVDAVNTDLRLPDLSVAPDTETDDECESNDESSD